MLLYLRAEPIFYPTDMKRILATLAIAALAIAATAQSRAYKQAMATLETTNNTSTITFSQETLQVINMLSFDLKEEMRNIVAGIEQMKLATCDRNAYTGFFANAVAAFEGENFKTTDISNYADPKSIRLFIKGGLTGIDEAHIILGRGKGHVVSFFGHFKLRDVKRLVKSAELLKNSF